jgi:hypothetical protein
MLNPENFYKEIFIFYISWVHSCYEMRYTSQSTIYTRNIWTNKEKYFLRTILNVWFKIILTLKCQEPESPTKINKHTIAVDLNLIYEHVMNDLGIGWTSEVMHTYFIFILYGIKLKITKSECGLWRHVIWCMEVTRGGS